MRQISNLLVAAACLLLVCCKKTEVIQYDRTSNNTILEYKVTNAADTIFGAIDNVNNTISLYIPYYVGIDYIVPAIKIDKGAVLYDAAGHVINTDGGILPVPVDTIGYTYTVMGSDSVKRTYTLFMEIAPAADSLKVGYKMTVPGGDTIDYISTQERSAYGKLMLYGNFGSTSANATFKLTNIATGKVYDNILSINNVTTGANYYAMDLTISPDADSGYYHVEMTHQARHTTLPDLHIFYNKPLFANIKSTASYAAGDTIIFNVNGMSENNNVNGSVIGVERVYMKFWKAGFDLGGFYPATFPDSLFGQEVAMKIIGMSRTQVKAIFPDLPEGAVGTYQYAGFTFSLPAIGFYFDFKDETGWGKNNMLCTTGRYFNITAKQ